MPARRGGPENKAKPSGAQRPASTTPATRNSRAAAAKEPRPSGRGQATLVAAILALVAACSVLWFHKTGQTLAYGDAEAHLNIARKLWDNYQPSYREIGTVWLPVPHFLMLPFTYSNALYETGLAGAIPAAICWILAGTFLFSAVRKLANGAWEPAGCAVAIFGLNPNLLYLAATPMTEPIFYMEVAGLLYSLASYRESESATALTAAILWTWLAALTRYEGWLLLPVASLFFVSHRLKHALIYSALGALAPLYILGHNWWVYGDPLEFYHGEWSAQAIYKRTHSDGFAPFPGEHNLTMSWLYYRTAAELAIGKPAVWMGAAGLLVALFKRWYWFALLLLAGPALTLWGMYSGGGVEIFVPTLWPQSYYNTRYGLALLLPAALGAGALVGLTPKLRGTVALILALAAVTPWLAFPRQDNWIVWKEAQINSAERRSWTRQMADRLALEYKPGEQILYAFGDLTGILREANIPLRATLQSGNQLEWERTLARPDLFLTQAWVLDFEDGKAASAARKRHYRVVARVRREHNASPVLLYHQ